MRNLLRTLSVSFALFLFLGIGSLKAQICNIGGNAIVCPGNVLGQEQSGQVGTFTGSEEWATLGKAPFPAPNGDFPYGFRYQRNTTTLIDQIERRSATSSTYDAVIGFGKVNINSPSERASLPRLDFKYIFQDNTGFFPQVTQVNVMTLTGNTSKILSPTGPGLACFGPAPCFGRVGIERTNPTYTLDVNGITRTTAVILGSDKRLKENIQTIVYPMDYLKEIRGTTYDFKKANEMENMDGLEGRQSGFIAQEVEAVLPELVYTDENGWKSVNYTGLIPYLVEGLNQVNTENEALKAKVQEMSTMERQLQSLQNQLDEIKTLSTSASLSTALDLPSLAQNYPNPFDESTTIEYFIPDNAADAQLLVFDLTGKQLQAFDLAERGQGKMTLDANSLEAGMYLYSLVVNGEEIDTKRMILTD